MHTCHQAPQQLVDIGVLANFDSIALIVTLFLMGMVGSFTHCIGMCGPIAVAQMSFRLINLSDKNITQKEKLKCAVTLPYYVGKAIAYAILGLIVYLFSKQLSDIAFFRNTALVILIVTGILFFQAAFFKTFTFIKLGWFNTLITRATSKLQLSTYGFKGLLLGMILGLIPCGLVYGGIITAAAYSENAVVMILAMLSFGLATTPGLFISAYFGSIVLIRFKKAFNILYVIMMILNGSLLMRYALKLI